MKLILKLLLLVVLGVAAFEGYIWYKVRATVTEAVEAASPFASIYYTDVVSSIFPREMGVDNIQINVQGQLLNLQSVRLKVDSIWDLYAIERDPQELFKRGIALEVRGLDVTDFYSQAMSAAAEQQGFAHNVEQDACSPMPQVGISDLREMGFEELLIDAEMKIRPASGVGPGGFSISGRAQEMAEFSMDLDLLLEVGDPMMMAMQMQNVDFESLSYSLRDLGYSQRWINLCSRRRALTPALFVEEHLLELQQAVADEFGLGLKSGMLEAYRSYLRDGGRVRIALQPQTSQWMEQLQFYPPEEYADLLGLELYLDGRQLQDVGFTQPLTVEADAAPLIEVEPAVAEPEFAPVAPVVPSESEAAKQEESKVLGWQELAQYSGPVRITTSDGERHEGVISAWSERRLMLQKRVGAGRFTFPIPRGAFRSAQSMR